MLTEHALHDAGDFELRVDRDADASKVTVALERLQERLQISESHVEKYPVSPIPAAHGAKVMNRLCWVNRFLVTQVLAAPRAAQISGSTATRVYYFDYVRVWATCAVILLHASATAFVVYEKPSVDFASRFTIADFGDTAGRFGVGCFFMLSGALLLAPDRSFRLGKHLRRVGIPLLVWSGLYLLFKVFLAHEHLPVFGTKAPHLDPKSILASLLRAPMAYHLWYLYVLIAIYLVLPLLRPLTALPEHRRGQLLRYALAVWLVFVVVIPTVQRAWPHAVIDSRLFPSMPVGYLGTVLLGFYLHHHGVPIRNRAALALGVVLAGTATALIFFEMLTHGQNTGWLLGNLTPQVVLYTSFVFLFAKSAFDRPGRAYPFVALFSRLSFRIFLVHALVLFCLISAAPIRQWYLAQPLVSIPFVAVLTLAISFAFAWLVEQIKPLRNYL